MNDGRFLNPDQLLLALPFLLYLQFNLGIVFGIDAVLKGAPEALHENVEKGLGTAISEIKSMCEAFNRTVAREIGKEVQQFLVDHYSPAADLFEKLLPEIDKASLDPERVAYYVDLYRSFKGMEMPPGKLH